MNRIRLIAVLFFLLSAVPHFAQEVYEPDTTLEYTTFLRQCREFTTRSAEEYWVVNFWASYNTPSLYVLPKLKEVYDLYQGKDIRFISISVDRNQQSWENALMREKLPWEQLRLPGDSEYGYLRRAFKHRSFPAIFLVHLDGRIERVVDVKELKLILKNQTSLSPNSGLGADQGDPFQGDGLLDYVEHKVRRGETLYSLQRQYDVKWQKIMEFNKLSSTQIKEGQILKIPQP